MSSKTAFYRLGDLTDWFSGGTPSKKNPECWGDEIPWISASSMGGSRYSNSDLKITKLGLESGSRLALKGSILLLVRGSTLHNRIPVGIAVRDVAFNQDVKAIRVKPELAARQVTDEMYLYYWLKANEKKLLEMVEHTGIGAGKLDTKRLQDLEIRLPSWSEQRQIVASATAIDEKEILNSCINQTLEQMAQAIFKSWFVDFEPVKAKIAALEAGGSEEDALLAAMQAISGKGEEKLTRLQAEQPEQYAELRATAELFPSAMQDSELGEIPEGWEASDFGSVSNCFDRHRIPLSKRQREQRQGSIPYYGATSIMDYVDEPIFDGVYLLLGEDGSVLKEDGSPFTQYIWGKSWVNNHAHVLQGANGVSTEQLYLFIGMQNITAYVTGAVQLKLNQKNMNSIPFIKAPDELNTRFAKLIAPMFGLRRTLTEENGSLTGTRDALLPRLLSGELCLSVAEDHLAEEAESANV